jgi:hypothetical protein
MMAMDPDDFLASLTPALRARVEQLKVSSADSCLEMGLLLWSPSSA